MAYDQTGFEIEAPVVDEVGQIILKARELLSDPAKWCKDRYEDGEGFCILGAMHQAAGVSYDDEANDNPTLEDACTRIQRMAGTHPARFNDDPNTTHADVIALLDRAAAGGGQ